jgi:cell division protein FtsZ
MEGRIRVSVVATGIDAELMRAPPPSEKVRTLHPHLNLNRTPPRVAEPVRPVPVPVPAAAVNPVHATVEALAQEIGAGKPAAADYVLGGSDAPEVEPVNESAPVRYPAVESYRPLAEQPLAQSRAPEKKSGWGFFGRKKAASDMRAEPAPEPRYEQRPAAARATVQPLQQPQAVEAPRANADDLFPDHKREEQFEIPAFLRRQSN